MAIYGCLWRQTPSSAGVVGEIACYANYPIKRRTEGGALMILVSFVIPHRRQKAMEGDCATSASGNAIQRRC